MKATTQRAEFSEKYYQKLLVKEAPEASGPNSTQSNDANGLVAQTTSSFHIPRVQELYLHQGSAVPHAGRQGADTVSLRFESQSI
jgi:hypothetical protein